MNHRKVRNKMRIIDADKFLKYLIFSKHIDGLTCGEVKEAIEMCKVDILDKIKTEIAEIHLIGYATVDGKREIARRAVMQIIDKYKAESEGQDDKS